MVVQRGKVLVKADPGEVDDVVAGGVLLAVRPEEIHHREVIRFELFRRIRIKLIRGPIGGRK